MTTKPEIQEIAPLSISPYPWKVNGSRQILAGDGDLVTTVWYKPSIQIAEANTRVIVTCVNSYAKHCVDPLRAAEEDLLGQAIVCLLDLMSNPAINHGKHDNPTLGCLDEIRDILSKTSKSLPHCDHAGNTDYCQMADDGTWFCPECGKSQPEQE